MKKILIWAAALAVIIALFALFGGKKRATNTDDKTEPRQPAATIVSAEGRVEALPGFEIEVGSELEGRIAEIFVEEGTILKKGDPIARMQDKDIRAKLRESEAEASAAQAKYREVATGSREEEIRRAEAASERARAEADTAHREAVRYRQLYEKGMVSRSALEEIERLGAVAAARKKEADEEKALVKQGPKKETIAFYQDSSMRAEASAQYFKEILNKALITAPISGKIIRKYLQKGEMVSKDVTPHIVTIADPSKIRINAEVDETDIAKFGVGDPAEISSYAYPGKKFSGVVQEIADYAGLRKVLPNNPAKNRDMKIVQVKIELKDKTPFRLGMTVDVAIKPKTVSQ